MVSYDAVTESHEFGWKETPLGKVDAICNPLKVVGIIKNAPPGFRDYVIDRCIPAGYQQITGNSASVFLGLKFVQEHLPKGNIIMSRRVPNDSSPVQEAELTTVLKRWFATTNTFPRLSTPSTSFGKRYSLLFLMKRAGLSGLGVIPFEGLLPLMLLNGFKLLWRMFAINQSKHLPLPIDRRICASEFLGEFRRSIRLIPVDKDSFFPLRPALCFSHTKTIPEITRSIKPLLVRAEGEI